MTPTLTIVHTPTGRDHSYLALPEERSPRDPVGGDMVSLGVVTRPGLLAEHVRVHWTRNGRQQTTIGARPDSRGTDQDRWLVELGVMEGGDTVEYWIEVEGGGQTARTAHERFTTRRWRRLARITGHERIDGGLRLSTAGRIAAPVRISPWATTASTSGCTCTTSLAQHGSTARAGTTRSGSTAWTTGARGSACHRFRQAARCGFRTAPFTR